MRALTIWQPWAHLIALGHKRIENRPWHPPHSLLGCDFAIHAGKKWDSTRLHLVEEAHGSVPDESEVIFGAVIAVARLAFFIGEVDGLDAIAKLAPGQECWFIGPCGWILEDIRQIPSIECRGMQKLWDLPTDVERRVMYSLKCLERMS